jgi:hypothetical protein
MIVGICGLQCSGKDTLGNILVKNFGFKKLSFADVLKDIVAIIFSWPREMLEGATNESRIWREQVDTWWSNKLNIPNLTPRYILQYIGTDLFRNHFHSDIWITIIEYKLQLYPNIVITDCRFPNEINLLKNYGAKFIKITRGLSPNWFILYESNQIEQPTDIHPSEYMWIKTKFDYLIDNNGSIQDLEDFCSTLITK